MPLNDYLSSFAATPVDTSRNSDFDEAFGLNEQPGDSGAVQFTKGLQSSMMRNTAEGRQVTMEIIKEKLAAKAALALEKAKMELAQQYPTYQSHVTPYGAVYQINPHKAGDVSVTMPGGGDAAEMGSAYNKAQLAKYQAEAASDETKAKPEYQQGLLDQVASKTALEKAQADYYKGAGSQLKDAQADLARKRAENLGKPQPKIPGFKDAQAMALQEMGYMGQFAQLQAQKDFQADPSKLAEFNQRVAAHMSGPPQAGGAQQKPMGAMPDVSGLMDLSTGLGDDSGVGQDQLDEEQQQQ